VHKREKEQDHTKTNYNPQRARRRLEPGDARGGTKRGVASNDTAHARRARTVSENTRAAELMASTLDTRVYTTNESFARRSFYSRALESARRSRHDLYLLPNSLTRQAARGRRHFSRVKCVQDKKQRPQAMGDLPLVFPPRPRASGHFLLTAPCAMHFTDHFES